MFLPRMVVGLIYFITVCLYGFVCICFSLETVSALWVSMRIDIADDEITSSPPDKSLVFIIAAYMNNEWDILDETLEAYTKLEYSGNITVMVVYNSKGDISDKEEIVEKKWHGTLHGEDRNIHIVIEKNHNSSSKAENVNYGLDQLVEDVSIVAIMDADHHPNPKSSSEAIYRMDKGGYDIIQGACTIRNQDNFLSTIVSVEFEDMYSVGHQGRLAVFDLGVFGGSNGYWKADVLNEIKMDGTMLTEDIDSSIRATLKGYRIGYSSRIVSSELAPLKNNTLQKQRLRWAQGWAEVASKHLLACMLSKNLSYRQKFGMTYLLGWREAFIYVTFWPALCIISGIIRYQDVPVLSIFTVIGSIVFIMGISRTIVTYLVATGDIRKNGRAFLSFSVCNLFYSVYLNYIQVCSHGRSLLKLNNWVATVRETKKIHPHVEAADIVIDRCIGGEVVIYSGINPMYKMDYRDESFIGFGQRFPILVSPI